MSDPYQLDRRAVRNAFNKAAATFDSAAVLHREAGNRLLDRLALIRGEPKTILDLGSGSGYFSRALKDRFPRASVIALDFSEEMLQQARKRRRWIRNFDCVCGDGAKLPITTQSIDWCISSLMLAWTDPPDSVFAEVQRVLKLGGLFSFTTFGPDTLQELRAAWSTLDSKAHVHRFIDMHDLGDALMRSGFAEPVMDVDRIVLTYRDAKQLLRELKDAGGVTATLNRARHLTGRTKLAALGSAYDAQAKEGRISATFEIIYGQAWRGELARPNLTGGETRIPIDSLRGRRRP
jgi:malonyl-CoA O-methyltransferase